jgi:hypothetical protein
MQHVHDNHQLICWSKICLSKDEWTEIIVAGFVAALFMLPIVYFLILR